jgi:hypothetical protein
MWVTASQPNYILEYYKKDSKPIFARATARQAKTPMCIGAFADLERVFTHWLHITK